MNVEKPELLLKNFSQAIRQLEKALKQPKNEFIRDSAIQRFEFTFELCWKTLQAFLEIEGLESHSPREAIQNAYQAEWISDDPSWLEMLKLRNLTSHTYNRKTAEQLYRKLPSALKKFQFIEANLQAKTKAQRHPARRKR